MSQPISILPSADLLVKGRPSFPNVGKSSTLESHITYSLDNLEFQSVELEPEPSFEKKTSKSLQNEWRDPLLLNALQSLLSGCFARLGVNQKVADWLSPNIAKILVEKFGSMNAKLGMEFVTKILEKVLEVCHVVVLVYQLHESYMAYWQAEEAASRNADEVCSELGVERKRLVDVDILLQEAEANLNDIEQRDFALEVDTVLELIHETDELLNNCKDTLDEINASVQQLIVNQKNMARQHNSNSVSYGLKALLTAGLSLYAPFRIASYGLRIMAAANFVNAAHEYKLEQHASDDLKQLKILLGEVEQQQNEVVKKKKSLKTLRNSLNHGKPKRRQGAIRQ